MKDAVDRFFRNYDIVALANSLRGKQYSDQELDRYMEKKMREAECGDRSSRIRPQSGL